MLRLWTRRRSFAPHDPGRPQRIRRLELELGFRGWDDQDTRDVYLKFATQVRYIDPSSDWFADRVAEEKSRMGCLDDAIADAEEYGEGWTPRAIRREFEQNTDRTRDGAELLKV